MIHQKKGRKFGREKGQRRAFMKSLATALVMKGKIKTTLTRAKELRHFAERLVTYGKNTNKITAFRKVGQTLSKIAAKKLMTDVAPKYAERNGGYTRVIKSGQRKSDSAEMAFIEFI